MFDPPTPGSELGSMIELLGDDATLALIEAYAGTRVSVPKVRPVAHPLLDLLGEAHFGLLFQYFGAAASA